MPNPASNDPDVGKGAVEAETLRGDTPTSLVGQLPHRNKDVTTELDTDFPEPGAREEHSGESSDGK
jgi:hypothetical protein